MTRVVGTRIGAMLGARDRLIRFLGWGVYQGDEVPPDTIGGFNMGLPNPKLLLDSGKVVWGCECWWGPADNVQQKLDAWRQAGYTIEDIDIDVARAESEIKP